MECCSNCRSLTAMTSSMRLCGDDAYHTNLDRVVVTCKAANFPWSKLEGLDEKKSLIAIWQAV